MKNMDTFKTALSNAILDEAKAEGVTCDMFNSEDSEEAQIAGLKQAVKDGYQVIICNLISSDIAQEVEAIAGDIPIVFINTEPASSQLQANKYVYTGSDEEEAGRFQAEYILEKCKDKDEINAVIMMGEYGHGATIGRTTAFENTIKDSGKKLNVVFKDYGNWNRSFRHTNLWNRCYSRWTGSY